jgi:predicted mannosyl-3-phosphoglycerate phosphatase (HAD superfamily)
MKFVVFTDLDATMLDLTTCEWLSAQESLLGFKLSNCSLVFAPPDDFSGVR